MRRASILVLSAVLVFASGVSAQSWTEEEQAVLDTLKTCWDAWQEATQQKDFDVWRSKCQHAPDYSMWWAEFSTPVGPDFDRRMFDFYSNLNERWIAFHPVAIRTHGNVAIVHFYAYWQPIVEGKPVTTEYKRTEVFLKKDGQWMFIGGHGTPTSPKDQDPYK
jgi:hypothetical protein